MESKVIKIIELEDEYVSKANEFPYILSIKSRIRFRLRSKYCFDHQPILLIEKLQSFDYILPLKNPIDVTSQKILNNFVILTGNLTKDGAWQVDLPPRDPGVVSFQLAFVEFGEHMTNRYGSYDTILLCQNKFQLRKLRKQTVFARCIGRCNQWPAFFRSQKQIGYNAFHFAPIQQTGASNSYYSLKNHLQLSSQLFSGTAQQKNAQLVSILEPLKQQGIVFFIDIILNHTSFDSQWIRSQPDAVFTIDNTPMLYTAYLVDGVIYEWGEEVKEMMSFDVQFTEEILVQIQENLKSRLESLQLHEYFQMSPQIQDILLATVPPSIPSQNIFAKDPVQSIQQFFDEFCTAPNNSPFGVTILNIDAWTNLKLAYEQNDLKLAITSFNKKWEAKIINEWIPQILSNTIGNVRHNFVQNTYRSFDDPYPLVNKYFSRVNGTDGEFFALNNGWVGGNDSRELFVVSKQYYYFRRKVNVWGDLIRIRYGSQPSDSQAAWAYMLKYVRQMAKYFDGFRMDNLHGTPIFVARHMIRQARRVNPNLVVFAELFTNTAEETAEFVKQIGINSTLKQVQHLLSGDSIVDFFHNKINFTNPYLGTLNRLFEQNGETIKYAVRKRPIPLIYDLTHDNQTFISQKKTILQTPLAICLAFIGSFTGSTKGFDQFYNKKVEVTQMGQLYAIDVSYPPVNDKSQLQSFLVRYTGQEKCAIYGNWDGWKEPNPMLYHAETKTQYVVLHLSPGTYQFKFYSEQKWVLQEKRKNNGTNHVLTIPHIDQPNAIYRNLQSLRQSTSKLSEQYFDFKEYHVYNIGNIVVMIREPSDHLQSICVIVNVSTKECAIPDAIGLVGKIVNCQIWLQSDLQVYQGLTTQTQIRHSTNIHEFFEVTLNESTGSNVLSASFLPPGFGCFIYCRQDKAVRQTIVSTDQLISRPINLPLLGPLQINGLFFNCSQEQEHLWGQSSYSIPQDKNNQLVYAGFAGAFQAILKSKRSGNLNEGIFQNLRAGNWLLDYYLNRARRYNHLASFVQYLEKVFQYLGLLPRYLIPKYFTNFIYKLILAIKEKTNQSTDFQKSLAFASCQFINYFPNCSLPDKSLLSAGLPHFSVGWARCWGRDTFTSTEILRLYPSIYRETILQYASAMRHGLIPNLLDQGRRPRYNSRDACWWFMKGIIDYIEVTKDYQILKNKVDMLFLSSDKAEHQKLKSNNKKKIMLLQQIVQEIFQSHASGITFREWSSGYEIDSNMTSEGFNITLEVDVDTGFVLGGNVSNCLTWMDKMGSSTHAATKGVPSTPRAGSPIELVGLLYFALCQFQKLNISGHYTFNGIQFHGKRITFRQWAEKIQQNFDCFFFLREGPSQSNYVRGIYKDLAGSPLRYDEQRFRPNALIALAVSPNLCIPEHAISYITKVEEFLLQPKSIGVATLAEMHTPYAPFYDNSDDSTVAKIAHGFSYHNGPQWVWLYGFYLVAKLNFQRKTITKNKAMTLLQQHIKFIEKSQWLSLPELTNRNGQKNGFSCNAQAWSISSVLMALRHIETLENDK